MNLYYLKNGKEKLPLSLSFKTLSEFQSKTNSSWNDIDTNLELYPELFYIALKNGYKKEGISFDLTIEQTTELLDDLYFDFQALILNEFVPDVQKKMKVN